ncbi:UDP-N-acetylmuramoyl-tripeptide--D-alanyl-D-alanine ligase [candidate division WWE3 bacterium]|nr:UDP-N-acetylmuramoyl-tripeptide--D-alanyl-D-alanine ligase [candidate division WWE3 bacterium]
MQTNKLKTLIKESKLSVCLDSRQIKKGDYFIPVVGENHDGHRFIEAALKNGAAGVIEENELYDLARFKISLIKPKIIGVTGSSGKTTTTQFIYQLLATKHSTTLGHLNTKLGLAVDTINEMNLDCKYFIAEMGMDRAGELEETTELFSPNVAVITTINETHMEKLGSLEKIAKAKFGIAKNLKKEGTLILNADNEAIQNYVKRHRPKVDLLWFSLKDSDDINPKKLNKDIFKNFKIPGEHNKSNLLASLSVLKALNEPIDNYIEQITQLQLPKGRLTKLEGINNSVILDDTYNANPESTKAALKVLDEIKGKRKIAVLGNMLELGDYEKEGHEKVGEAVTQAKVDFLVTVGDLGEIISKTAQVNRKIHLDKSTDFKEALDKGEVKIKEGDVFLVKGSQGARMEKITEVLLANPGRDRAKLVRQDVRWE